MTGIGAGLVALLLATLALIPVGLRDGDVAGDLQVTDVRISHRPRGVIVEVVNPGPAPMLIGLSLRHPGLRLQLESGTYARLRTRRTSPELLAGHQTVIAALQAGEAGTFPVPAPAGLGARAELVIVAGRTGRLRAIHRSVRLAAIDDLTGPARAPRPVVRQHRDG